MLVEIKQMMPVTRLQISYQEYEYLKDIEETFEQFEIKNVIEFRLKNYDPEKKYFVGRYQGK